MDYRPSVVAQSRVIPSTPRPIGKVLSTTARTTLFTAAGNLEIPMFLHVANVTGTSAWVTVEWYSAKDATHYTLVYQKPVLPNTTGIDLDKDAGFGFQMAAGDIIEATAQTANALHCTLGVIEIAGRSS